MTFARRKLGDVIFLYWIRPSPAGEPPLLDSTLPTPPLPSGRAPEGLPPSGLLQRRRTLEVMSRSCSLSPSGMRSTLVQGTLFPPSGYVLLGEHPGYLENRAAHDYCFRLTRVAEAV